MSRHTVLIPESSPRIVPPGLCALGVMTKVPVPGKVKTRLTPPLTPAEAAELNTCFLRDTASAIADASATCAARGVGVFTPVGGEAAYENILPHDFYLIAQRDGDFGKRLVFAVEDLLRCGFEAVCLIDSDSPTVPASSYIAAVEALIDSSGDRVVIGPSDDGGYYLIGMRRVVTEVFTDIAWSTERVLEETIQRARSAGVETTQLTTGYDVDDAVTLKRLCDELLGEKRSSAPATRAFLEQIVAREGRDRIWPHE